MFVGVSLASNHHCWSTFTLCQPKIQMFTLYQKLIAWFQCSYSLSIVMWTHKIKLVKSMYHSSIHSLVRINIGFVLAKYPVFMTPLIWFHELATATAHCCVNTLKIKYIESCSGIHSMPLSRIHSVPAWYPNVHFLPVIDCMNLVKL